MAWQTPKTNWSAEDGVRDSDMNRIEGNALALYEETARSNITIYVATTGNDSTGNGTSANPYKTIAKALSMLPKNLAGLNVTVYISAGTYAEAVSIKGFAGGVLRLSGASSNVTLNSLSIEEAVVSAVSLPLTLTAAVGLIVTEVGSFNTTGNVTTTGSSVGANINSGGVARIAGTHNHSGGGTAVSCSGNGLYNANSITGSGNLQASGGGVISSGSSTLSRSATTGGRIHIGTQGSGVGVASVE